MRECKPSKEDLEEEEEDLVEEEDERGEIVQVEKEHISFLKTYCGRTAPEPNRFAIRWEGHQAR